MSATKGRRSRLTNRDLATLARDHTPEQIAAAYSIQADTVRTRLRLMGRDDTGQPLNTTPTMQRERVVTFDRDRDESWRDLAECRIGGHDPELWFPEGWDAYQRADARAARAICGRCEVRAACLDATMRAEGGLSASYRHGIAGGMDPKERAALARIGGAA